MCGMTVCACRFRRGPNHDGPSAAACACAAYGRNSPCRKLGTVCVAPNETRTINGMQVTRACWEYEDAYECRTENLSGDCDQLRAKGCSQKSSVCIDRDKDGACLLYDQRFDCPDKPQQFVERTVCDQATFCQDGGAGCFETGAPPDQDLGKSIAMMEASREAAIYGVEPGKVELFKGYQEECSVKVLGGGKIKSCCGSSDGGQEFTNYRIMASTSDSQLPTLLRRRRDRLLSALFRMLAVRRWQLGPSLSTTLSMDSLKASSLTRVCLP